MRFCILVEVAATGSVAALTVSADDGVTTARSEGGAIVAARGGTGGGSAIVAYGKLRVVSARSSRRATVAAMNVGFSPRTKAIYIRVVG